MRTFIGAGNRKANMQKKIVIVGGGFVGFEVAKGLQKHADVTLIEQREAFSLQPATIRSLVDPSLINKLLIPYDKLLSHGRVLRARVVSIQFDSVTLADGTMVAADYILVATGSTYAAPFKPSGESVEDFVRSSKETGKLLADAKTVAIVGAGAVGTELAGEIATAQPGKKITLISSENSLFPLYNRRLGKSLAQKLSALGVDVVFGQRAEDLQQTGAPFSGSITLTNGNKIEADLIFPVVGSKARSELLSDLPGVESGALGRIKTDSWMRPSVYPNLFIAGDIADVGDGMTIVATARQNPWMIKTFKALITGKSIESLKPYAPWKKAPILIPLGTKKGNSWLFAVVGNLVTSAMKGKDAFIPKYRKAFGYFRK